MNVCKGSYIVPKKFVDSFQALVFIEIIRSEIVCTGDQQSRDGRLHQCCSSRLRPVDRLALAPAVLAAQLASCARQRITFLMTFFLFAALAFCCFVGTSESPSSVSGGKVASYIDFIHHFRSAHFSDTASFFEVVKHEKVFLSKINRNVLGKRGRVLLPNACICGC